MSFVEDNLLKTANSISHHNTLPTEDEELSPSMVSVVVVTWLRLLHPQLPRIVKQKYGTELRTRTIASIKPEISEALPALLDEFASQDEARAMRTSSTFPQLTFSQNDTRPSHHSTRRP